MSPKGKQLLFESRARGRTKLVKVDGTGLLDLGTGGEPDRSSDGTQGTDYIALAVMRADGSNPVEIWHTPPKTNNFNVGAAWGTAP